MSRFNEKGYYVKENAPIYCTNDMDATAKWFEDVLGWYSQIVAWDAEGKGSYGVVFDMLPEVEHTHLAPFTGFQLFTGTPVPHLISFMQVSDVEKMHQWIVSKGWKQVTEMVMEPWGSKTFVLTTIDGYTIKVFG